MFLSHIYLIPLFPALGAALMFFFGRKLQKPTVSAVCVGSVVLAFLMSCGAVLQYTSWAPRTPSPALRKNPLHLARHRHRTSELTYKSDGTQAPVQADAGFLLDPLSSIWLLFVTGVGMLIHIYSTGYMAHEGGYYRFFGYLNLFMFSMLTLILANNYVLMFVGWEGVGLCSYLLIGFYFHRKSASDAANKAFIVNRIGDAGFLLGMFFIAWYMGSLRFIDVTARRAERPVRHRRSHHHRRHAASICRSLREVGAATALCLAAGRHGRPHAGLRAHPCRDHGHRRRLHGGAFQRFIRAGPEIHAGRRHRRRAHRHLRRLHRPGTKRHQARPRLLDRLATWLHVPRAGRRSLLRRASSTSSLTPSSRLCSSLAQAR